MIDLKDVSTTFQRFANNECKGSSPLYFTLSNLIASDDQILKIAAQTKNRQPIPNLLFASVHFLLHTVGDATLERFYGSFSEQPDSPKLCYPHFKRFILSHQKNIVELLHSRLVQTNEVKRSAYLYPAIGIASNLSKNKSLCLIEIGAAAGFNLCFDKYGYKVGSLNYGNPTSPLIIKTEFKNSFPHGAIPNDFNIVRRISIDLNVIDLNNLDDRTWMKSLIWPEHRSRIAQFNAATEITRDTDIHFCQGDAIELLEEQVANIPPNMNICVFHTHVANQMNKDQRRALVELIAKIGKQRSIYHLYNNIGSADLQLEYFPDGKREHILLAQTEGHGNWVKWLNPAATTDA